jgi:hypothetical protein
MTKQPSQTPHEVRAELLEAIRVNEGLLCEQQAHLSMHASRLESFEWQLEAIRQKIDRQFSNHAEAPGRLVAIQARLDEQRVLLSKLEAESGVRKVGVRKIGMKQVCELLGTLMGDPATIKQGQELLKGINQGVEFETLWVRFGGGQHV